MVANHSNEQLGVVRCKAQRRLEAGERLAYASERTQRVALVVPAIEMLWRKRTASLEVHEGVVMAVGVGAYTPQVEVGEGIRVVERKGLFESPGGNLVLSHHLQMLGGLDAQLGIVGRVGHGGIEVLKCELVMLQLIVTHGEGEVVVASLLGGHVGGGFLDGLLQGLEGGLQLMQRLTKVALGSVLGTQYTNECLNMVGGRSREGSHGWIPGSR